MFLKLLSFLFATSSVITPATFSVYPDQIIQGDPIAIVSSQPDIQFNGKKIASNKYKDKYVAFVGTDINQKVGDYEVIAGDLKKKVAISPRPKIQENMSIPTKLGGDTKESKKVLIQTMAVEADTLRNLVSTTTQLWKEKFIFPVKDPVITDTYGYSRMTVGSVITHKGTDFRAPVGTKVFAMNDGIVRLVTTSRNYGKHIVIDHGNSLFTIYMHLSSFNVVEGEMVKRGQVIALSGDTGYVHGAHLHLSIKIGPLSVDPMVFLDFFK